MIIQPGTLAPTGAHRSSATCTSCPPPRFETGDDRYSWLNDHVFVAEGKADMLQEDGYLAEVSWRIYTVHND